MELMEATACDYAAVTELVNVAYRGQAGWTNEWGLMAGARVTEASLAKDLRDKAGAHLLLYREAVDGPVLGTVWLEEQAEGTWYLGLLTVRPEMQDRRLGRGLLEAAEGFAQARGARRMRMTVVHVRETLIAWYERRGYRRTGEVEAFANDDERFGRALRERLEFVVMEKAL